MASQFLSKRLLIAPMTLLAGLAVTVSAFADTTIPVDFTFAGYMRSATGDNIKGGKQSCFSNPGSVANEFRLGNECGTYGEASFRAMMLKPQTPDDAFFKSQLTFAYGPPNDTQYEDASMSGNHDMDVVEAFVEGGNFGDFKAQIWAGKRFYRMIDASMNDFYYFDNMNGAGGGIEKWKVLGGSLNIAVLRESTFTQTGLPATGAALPKYTRVDSQSAGVLGKTALDVRYDMTVTPSNDISLWGVAAYSPPGSGTTINPSVTGSTAAPSYQAGQGYVAGLYHRHRFETAGYNDVAVAYGTGIMQTLEMGQGYGGVGPAGVIEGSGGNGATRLRVVDSFMHNFGNRWSTQVVGTFENRNSGAGADSASRWWNLGVRPYYALSEHFSLVGEAGFSEVKDDADRDANGGRVGPRQMARVTFAPQFAIATGMQARPVIRLFASQTMWNQANQAYGKISSTSAFANELSGASVGIQGEVWF